VAVFLGVKQVGLEADHPPPSSAEVKKAWSYTSTFHVFNAWCLVKAQRQLYRNFTGSGIIKTSQKCTNSTAEGFSPPRFVPAALLHCFPSLAVDEFVFLYTTFHL
jgi:hypothetical protein